MYPVVFNFKLNVAGNSDPARCRKDVFFFFSLLYASHMRGLGSNVWEGGGKILTQLNPNLKCDLLHSVLQSSTRYN